MKKVSRHRSVRQFSTGCCRSCLKYTLKACSDGGEREEDPKTEPKVRLFSKKQKLKNNFCPHPMVKDSKNYGTAHHY